MTDAPLQIEVTARRWTLFMLALKTALLTILTLGLYRFWMKTRLRRFYWSAIRPGGIPLEYAGLPIEKLLGFLIAVTFLAFYIGIVNLILMFGSFALLNGNVAAYALSFVGVIPILFYARYRARRYVLGRTRWRGIRFGVEPGAWGYAWRALLYWALTLLTLGLLWPLKAFRLEKYRTDRTYYGTQPIVQNGRWTMLIRPFLPLAFGVIGTILAGALGSGGQPGALFAPFATIPLTIYGLAYWNARAFARLSDAKRAGRIGFTAAPRVWCVLGIYVFGYLLIGLSLLLFLFALGAMIALLSAQTGLATTSPLDIVKALPRAVLIGAGLLTYFGAFLLFGVLSHVFIRLPLWRHYAETMTITGPEALPMIRQRGRDEMARAEGLAEALDLGAAI